MQNGNYELSVIEPRRGFDFFCGRGKIYFTTPSISFPVFQSYFSSQKNIFYACIQNRCKNKLNWNPTEKNKGLFPSLLFYRLQRLLPFIYFVFCAAYRQHQWRTRHSESAVLCLFSRVVLVILKNDIKHVVGKIKKSDVALLRSGTRSRMV